MCKPSISQVSVVHIWMVCLRMSFWRQKIWAVGKVDNQVPLQLFREWNHPSFFNSAVHASYWLYSRISSPASGASSTPMRMFTKSPRAYFLGNASVDPTWSVDRLGHGLDINNHIITYIYIYIYIYSNIYIYTHISRHKEQTFLFLTAEVPVLEEEIYFPMPSLRLPYYHNLPYTYLMQYKRLY